MFVRVSTRFKFSEDLDPCRCWRVVRNADADTVSGRPVVKDIVLHTKRGEIGVKSHHHATTRRTSKKATAASEVGANGFEPLNLGLVRAASYARLDHAPTTAVIDHRSPTRDRSTGLDGLAQPHLGTRLTEVSGSCTRTTRPRSTSGRAVSGSPPQIRGLPRPRPVRPRYLSAERSIPWQLRETRHGHAASTPPRRAAQCARLDLNQRPLGYRPSAPPD